MAVFNFTPTYGLRKKSKPKKIIQKLGDGYEHRTLFGLPTNQHPKEYDLTFEVSESVADQIETFLDARTVDNASFDFTPAGDSSATKYVCDSWTKTIPYNNRATISATFRQVFE